VTTWATPAAHARCLFEVVVGRTRLHGGRVWLKPWWRNRKRRARKATTLQRRSPSAKARMANCGNPRVVMIFMRGASIA